MNIRKANDSDIKRLVELESLFLSPYSEKQIYYELHDNPTSNVLVYLNDDDYVLGFIDFWITFDSATVCQVAVDKAYEHQGIATSLFNECFKILKNSKEEEILWLTLEVREHNVEAYNLYKKLGFKYVVTKEKYYSNGENALYMMKGLID